MGDIFGFGVRSALGISVFTTGIGELILADDIFGDGGGFTRVGVSLGSGLVTLGVAGDAMRGAGRMSLGTETTTFGATFGDAGGVTLRLVESFGVRECGRLTADTEVIIPEGEE